MTTSKKYVWASSIDRRADLKQKTVRLNGYCTEETGCMANLLIVPKAYLGWCTDLQDGACYEISGASLEKSYNGAGAWWKADIKTLKKHQQPDAKAVVQRLEEMYFEGKSRSGSRFGDILKAAINFHRKWVQSGGGTSKDS